MNIYFYELKSYLKSVLIWSISISGFIIMFMSFFPGLASDIELMEQIFASYPKEFLKAFGIDKGAIIATMIGFFSFSFAFVQILIAAQSFNYGFNVLSIEERELTADFLMTRPVSRTKIIISKFLAVFTSLTITNIIIWAASIFSFVIFSSGHEYSFKHLIMMLSLIALFQLYCLALGMLVSVSVKKIRSVLTYSMAFTFMAYILMTLGELLDSFPLDILTPFYYFDVGYIAEYGKYNNLLIIIGSCIIICILALSYLLYKKRNIQTV